jgi:hypothetical protein
VIVEATALERGVVEREAQRFDEVQACTDVRAEANDTPGVRRNLGMHENNIHCLESVTRVEKILWNVGGSLGCWAGLC